jgi:hypothetical protein
MAGSLGQEGRPFLPEHWQPTDESGIEFDGAILAGEVPAPPLPDEPFGRGSAFVRRDRGRPAICGGNSRPRRVQLDQLVAQLACAAE